MIEIQNVSFEYEKSQGTLSHIDLNIQQGECIVLNDPYMAKGHSYCALKLEVD